MLKLEFGNPDHVKLAERGMICTCGHEKIYHSSNCGHNADDGGNVHTKPKSCSCDEFNPKRI